MIDPKRSLGQNFINNKSLATKISSIVLEGKPGTILEIGSGTGVFTHLLSKDHNLISIEKDNYLYDHLKNISKLSNVNLINADIFDINLPKTLSNEKRPYISFGSLPYNQSKRIIRALLESDLFENHFYIIQKEVANKYLSSLPSNRLSINSQIFTKPTKILDISPGNFNPKPKVESSLIKFQRIERRISEENLGKFYHFINTSFSNPRKKIKNNIPEKDQELIPEKFINMRPSEITPKEYFQIFKSFN